MVIVPVLVCFTLILLMASVLLKIGLAQRTQTQGEERRLQAEWLAEAGLERAGAKLAAARDYTGETWTVPAEDLDARDAGLIAIQVEPVPDHPTRRRVTIVADFPRDADQRARQRKVALVEVGAKKEGPSR